MTLRLIGMFALLCIGSAHAVQPVEQGLRPILTRLQAISAQQKSLNLVLQNSFSTAQERASAYRTYKLMDQERLALECALERGKRVGELPLVTYASSNAPGACRGKG